MPIYITEVLDESVIEDLQGGGQAVGSNFEGSMNMLVDICSRLLATEEVMQEMRAERAATHA